MKKVNYKRELIPERLTEDLTYELSTNNLDKTINILNGYRDKYKETHVNLYLDTDQDYDFGQIVIRGSRLETDKEYEKRIKAEESRFQKEKDRHKTQEEKDRATYERLKKKFEGK